jgi:hypothetical protein
MGGDSQFKEFITGSFLQSDMAAPLAHDCPAVSLQRPNNLDVG